MVDLLRHGLLFGALSVRLGSSVSSVTMLTIELCEFRSIVQLHGTLSLCRIMVAFIFALHFEYGGVEAYAHGCTNKCVCHWTRLTNIQIPLEPSPYSLKT